MGPERGNIGEGHDREILLNIKRDHVNDWNVKIIAFSKTGLIIIW